MMSKAKNIWPGLGSKIEFSTPTPESFDGSKNDFFAADEEGMGFPMRYWPAMTRCPDCGRFMKRGIANWANHTTEDCPYFKKNKKASGILKYAEHNHVTIPCITPKLADELNKAMEVYFEANGGNPILIAGCDPYKPQPPTEPEPLIFHKPNVYKSVVKLPETRQERRARERKSKKK